MRTPRSEGNHVKNSKLFIFLASLSAPVKDKRYGNIKSTNLFIGNGH